MRQKMSILIQTYEFLGLLLIKRLPSVFAYFPKNVNFFEKIVSMKNVYQKICYKEYVHHFCRGKQVYDF